MALQAGEGFSVNADQKTFAGRGFAVGGTEVPSLVVENDSLSFNQFSAAMQNMASKMLDADTQVIGGWWMQEWLSSRFPTWCVASTSPWNLRSTETKGPSTTSTRSRKYATRASSVYNHHEGECACTSNRKANSMRKIDNKERQDIRQFCYDQVNEMDTADIIESLVHHMAEWYEANPDQANIDMINYYTNEST